MNKKLSIFISTALVTSFISISTLNKSNASEIINNYKSNDVLDNTNVKTEDISTSIPKTENPENGEIPITKIFDEKSKIESDLGATIDIPSNVQYGANVLKGSLAKGVGVTLYKVSSEDLASGKTILKSDMNLSDIKYSIQSQNGDFSISFDNSKLKQNEHFLICISYSMIDSNGNDIHKTYLLDTEYSNVSITDNKVDVDNEYRISGTDRYETNIKSIKKGFGSNKVDTMIITSGDSFADALAAGPLSMKKGYPILFSTKSGLTNGALNLIKEYAVKNIIIVGGQNSVPNTVIKQLSGLNVRRISGNDRYDTSKQLLNEFGYAKHIIVTDGRKFADALSATPLANKLKSPILLVEKSEDIQKNISTYSDVYIVGGKNSVSESIENNIKKLINDKKLYRVYGRDRTETSYQVATLTNFGENILVNGSSFADALSSSNIIGNSGKNLYLIGKESYPNYIKESIDGKNNYIVGGYNSILKSVLGY